MSTYRVTFVALGGRLKLLLQDKAPDTNRMLLWAMQRRARFVVRYWPSRKGWRLLDAREAQFFQDGTNFGRWSGFAYSTTIFPSEDAAVMAAIALSAA